jgi:hypothetical protein
MSISFGASLNLSFEPGEKLHEGRKIHDDWTVQRKVKIHTWDDEGELGDSCCFGTRTVQFGKGCVWKLHGGV